MVPSERSAPAASGPATALAVAAHYAAALLLGAGGAMIGAVLPCEGFLCAIGNAVVWGGGGILLGSLVAAWVARRMGLGWWYVPVTLLVLVAALWASSLADGFATTALVALAALAPVVGGALAGRLGIVPRVVTLAVVVAAALGAGVVGAQVERSQDAQQREARIERFRGAQVNFVAPASREGVEVRLVSVDNGEHPAAIYDLRTPEVPDWLRVSLFTDPERQECRGPGVRDLGGGVRGAGEPGEQRTVCRDFDDVRVQVWPDGSPNRWRGDAMVELAADLEPVEVEWLVERAR